MIQETRNFNVMPESVLEFLGLENEQRISNGAIRNDALFYLKKEMFTDKKMNYGDTVTINVIENVFSGSITHVFTYEFKVCYYVKSKFVLLKIDSEYNSTLEIDIKNKLNR